MKQLPQPSPSAAKAKYHPNHIWVPGAKSYPGHTGSPLDEPAKTLKAGVHGVPGGENMLRRPNGSVRYFSIHEAALLQTFPPSYKFAGSRTAAMRQIGNAAPVRVVEALARSLRSVLLGPKAKEPTLSHIGLANGRPLTKI